MQNGQVLREFEALFQSAPGREVGRCEPRRQQQEGKKCFNPRPAVRSGDACVGGKVGADLYVSIRARP